MKNNLSNIKKAKYYLDKNECIGIPTETVYGLAANAYSKEAVSKIFKLKKRPSNNPLIVHYYNINQLKNDCELNDVFIYSNISPPTGFHWNTNDLAICMIISLPFFLCSNKFLFPCYFSIKHIC